MALPAFCKIAEARLRISTAPGSPLRSAVDRRHLAPPPVRELWVCEIALTAMALTDLPAFQAWLEAFDGRAGDVDIAMSAAFSPQPAATVALAATAAQMASEITIDVAGAALPAGTLIAIGTQDGTQQVVEVLTEATVGTGRVVPIAPRIRGGRSAGAPIAVGAAAINRFRLASDAEGMPAVKITHGLAALTLLERV